MNTCDPTLSKSEQLYFKAKEILAKGIDASPHDVAPDDLACCETFDEVYKDTFGAYINGTIDSVTISTMVANEIMSGSAAFKKTASYRRGLVIVSPTVIVNSNVIHGHIGITGDYGIMSNNSDNGIFQEKWNFDRWIKYYQGILGLKVILYQPV